MQVTPMARARKKLGLSLEELAKRAGSTKGHLSSLENGRHRASPELAECLARELGIGEMEILYPERFGNR